MWRGLLFTDVFLRSTSLSPLRLVLDPLRGSHHRMVWVESPTATSAAQKNPPDNAETLTQPHSTQVLFFAGSTRQKTPRNWAWRAAGRMQSSPALIGAKVNQR